MSSVCWLACLFTNWFLSLVFDFLQRLFDGDYRIGKSSGDCSITHSTGKYLMTGERHSFMCSSRYHWRIAMTPPANFPRNRSPQSWNTRVCRQTLHWLWSANEGKQSDLLSLSDVMSALLFRRLIYPSFAWKNVLFDDVTQISNGYAKNWNVTAK